MFGRDNVLLALGVYQVIISEKLPTTSDAVPVIGKSYH